jgi:hypothetical protein
MKDTRGFGIGVRMRKAKWCIAVVLFVCSWVILSLTIGDKLDANNQKMGNRLRPVRAESLYRFFVLTIAPPDQSYRLGAHIVSYPEAMLHINDKPGFSFLIPSGAQDELNQQLRMDNQDSINTGGGGLRVCGFRAKWLSNERQSISLMSDDGIVRYCYIASAKSIIPQSYSIRVPKGRDTLYAMGTFIGAFVNAVIWFLVWANIHVLRIKRPSSP